MPRPLKKGACNTCRRRKLKCDQGTPVCQQCAKSSRYCDRSERPTEFRLSQPIESLPSPDSPRRALEDQRIARLYHHYIADLSKWYDLSDSGSTFEIVVPQIALEESLLFCAVIALSAMHLCKTTTRSIRPTAEFYHRRCVRLLIALGEQDELISKGTALAATCLLRSYEILDGDKDPNMHLRGAYSMASRQDLFSKPRQQSLLEAGFWNYLREDITFSLFENCPLKISLEAFPLPFNSDSEHESDQDHMNSLTLILGQIINSAFDGQMEGQEWYVRFDLVSRWSAACLNRLLPFSRGLGVPGTAESLPPVWFLQPCQAATVHYYLVALTILCHRATSEQFQDFRSLDLLGHEPNSREELLEAFALDICGIAFTAKVPSVLVNAFGPIAYCAKFIRAEAPQQEVVRQLLACKATIGWPVQRLVENLGSFWGTEKA